VTSSVYVAPPIQTLAVIGGSPIAMAESSSSGKGSSEGEKVDESASPSHSAVPPARSPQPIARRSEPSIVSEARLPELTESTRETKNQTRNKERP
jgi:hypothetical protein